jgi:hypothetical protein
MSALKVRMERIHELCRGAPTTHFDVADLLYLHPKTAKKTMEDMVSFGLLTCEGNLYLSVGEYKDVHVPLSNAKETAKSRIDLYAPIRLAPHIKPFRDEWTKLFFGEK